MTRCAPGDPKELNILKFRVVQPSSKLSFYAVWAKPSIMENLKKLYFPTLMHCGDNHSYNTRSVAKKLLDIPLLDTDTFGTRSSKYKCTYS